MTILAFLLVGLLVLANAFFVSAEYSLVRSRRSRLEEMQESGARGAALALRQLDAVGPVRQPGVYHLHAQQARQVMPPARPVVSVDVSDSVELALRGCVSSGHTRLVVTEDHNDDRVKGIVHANGLAQLLLADGP